MLEGGGGGRESNCCTPKILRNAMVAVHCRAKPSRPTTTTHPERLKPAAAGLLTDCCRAVIHVVVITIIGAAQDRPPLHRRKAGKSRFAEKKSKAHRDVLRSGTQSHTETEGLSKDGNPCVVNRLASHRKSAPETVLESFVSRTTFVGRRDVYARGRQHRNPHEGETQLFLMKI